jgi:hypothetical protein
MTTDPPITIRLHQPGDLIAALPAMLGFYPEQSLVAVHLRHHRVVLTARYNLDQLTGTTHPHILTAHTAYVPTDTIHLTLIANPDPHPDADTGADADAGPGGLLPYAPTVAAAEQHYRDAGIRTAHAVWTPAVQAGGPWRCYQHPTCHGTIPDPRSTPLAAATTLAGQLIHPNRQAIADQLTPDPPQDLSRRAALIATRPTPDAAQAIRTIQHAIQQATHGVLPDTDEQIADLAAALNHPHARDTSAALTAGPHTHAAEHLWTALTRSTPPPQRAEPAALLAIAAYLRGNTALATLALHAATHAQPHHTLSTLLHLAITTGLPPDQLRTTITHHPTTN